MIAAGRLVHRIDIQIDSGTRDPDSREHKPSWGTYEGLTDVPCEIVDTGGDERKLGSQTVATVDVTITMRNPGHNRFPKPKMRAVTRHQTPQRTFNIRQVRRLDPSGHSLELHCSEVPV